MSEIENFWVVIPAGGAGTRLWPLSRQASPKFLHDLTGTGRTLIQATCDRLAPLAGARKVVVTGQVHEAAVRNQLPELDGDAVLVEPSARDSMAAIGLAAAMIERRDPDAIIGSFAADHVIVDPAPFHDAVRTAAAAARAGWLVTIGIEPTQPATGFGYISVGDPLPDAPGVHHVREFVEKPSREVAAQYVAEGYRWNAGMFVARPGVILDLLAEQDQEFAAALREVAAHPERLAEIWPALPKIAIDHAVAEPAAASGRVAVVPGDFSWDDIGDFASLNGLLSLPALPADAEHGVRTLGNPGLVHALDSTGLVVPGSGRAIAVVGLEDVVVVDTGDALLVTTLARAQDVKRIVAALKEDGHESLT